MNKIPIEIISTIRKKTGGGEDGVEACALVVQEELSAQDVRKARDVADDPSTRFLEALTQVAEQKHSEDSDGDSVDDDTEQGDESGYTTEDSDGTTRTREDTIIHGRSEGKECLGIQTTLPLTGLLFMLLTTVTIIPARRLLFTVKKVGNEMGDIAHLNLDNEVPDDEKNGGGESVHMDQLDTREIPDDELNDGSENVQVPKFGGFEHSNDEQYPLCISTHCDTIHVK